MGVCGGYGREESSVLVRDPRQAAFDGGAQRGLGVVSAGVLEFGR